MEKLVTRYPFPEKVKAILKEHMGESAPDSITMRDAIPIPDERAVAQRLREDEKRHYQREMVMQCVVKIGDKAVEKVDEVEEFFNHAGYRVVEMVSAAWIARNQSTDSEVSDFIKGAEKVRA